MGSVAGVSTPGALAGVEVGCTVHGSLKHGKKLKERLRDFLQQEYSEIENSGAEDSSEADINWNKSVQAVAGQLGVELVVEPDNEEQENETDSS